MSHPATMQAADRAAIAALTVLVVTAVHHSYGAFVYDTPWRHHASVLSAVAAAAIIATVLVFRRGVAVGSFAFRVFATITLAGPVLGIGLFEGGYNHVVKDALYFAGTAPAVMRQLFPPPAYELPDDVFFEVTGVLQFVVAIVAAQYLYRLFRSRSSV